MKTRTKSFGTSARMGHDASDFYGRKLYQSTKTEKKYVEGINKPSNINQVYCQSSESMDQIADNSVHLMVTSPPYNVGKDYDADMTMEEYRKMLSSVWTEVHRVLVDGGRACINVANLGRKPYIPLTSYVIQDMLNVGFLMRGEIIWVKGAAAGVSCAWGSWCSPSNPVLRDVHEYILVFCKNKFGRENAGESTITKDEFLDNTKSVWSFNSESAKRVNHPAPYPIELPKRFIQLYTYANEIVLDPFMGSGTTAIAALKNDRQYIGYETSQEYLKICSGRIKKCRRELNTEMFNSDAYKEACNSGATKY